MFSSVSKWPVSEGAFVLLFSIIPFGHCLRVSETLFQIHQNNLGMGSDLGNARTLKMPVFPIFFSRLVVLDPKVVLLCFCYILVSGRIENKSISWKWNLDPCICLTSQNKSIAVGLGIIWIFNKLKNTKNISAYIFSFFSGVFSYLSYIVFSALAEMPQVSTLEDPTTLECLIFFPFCLIIIIIIIIIIAIVIVIITIIVIRFGGIW